MLAQRTTLLKVTPCDRAGRAQQEFQLCARTRPAQDRTDPELHIGATNVGAGLFRERKVYRIVFLRNATAIPFIAGDQPVINMLDPKATDDLELYYPLSPQLAIVLTKDMVKFPDRERSVSAFEVERYNYAIYSSSEDQI